PDLTNSAFVVQVGRRLFRERGTDLRRVDRVLVAGAGDLHSPVRESRDELRHRQITVGLPARRVLPQSTQRVPRADRLNVQDRSEVFQQIAVTGDLSGDGGGLHAVLRTQCHGAFDDGGDLVDALLLA